eukprot:TRINITY_DN2882_c0_g1_i3.p1 TRINITY_DN2882_c0_g1~~TRINITY_DN2882_c0_g1_i3.p1  ORF type:complete len:103 (-),score=13.89 TRINITY_DN2882_c0_g1_i3:303-575(-)
MSSVRVHYVITIKAVTNVNTTNPIRITWSRSKSSGKTNVVKMDKDSNATAVFKNEVLKWDAVVYLSPAGKLDANNIVLSLDEKVCFGLEE